MDAMIDHPLFRSVAAVAMIALFVLAAKRLRLISPREAAMMDALEGDDAPKGVMVPANSTREIMVSDSTAPKAVITARELRVIDRTARSVKGLCAHCDKPATKRLPEIRVVRPFLDGVLRWCGIVANDRWIITYATKGPKEVCDWHDTMKRRQLEKLLQDDAAERAVFAERQLSKLYEGAEYVADEIIEGDMARVRRGPKKERAKVEGAPVVTLASRKGNGTVG